MTPGEYQVKRERVRGAIAWARELARRSAQTRAIAAELTVIADDICSRARAERERARLLAMERPSSARRVAVEMIPCRAPAAMVRQDRQRRP
jgi:hypothetical protein